METSIHGSSPIQDIKLTANIVGPQIMNALQDVVAYTSLLPIRIQVAAPKQQHFQIVPYNRRNSLTALQSFTIQWCPNLVYPYLVDCRDLVD